MIDCGEGTVRQMLKSYVRASKIDSVFITHLHGDHYYGLPGLGMRMVGLREFNNKTKLFAPVGIQRFLGNSVTRNFDLQELIPPSDQLFRIRNHTIHSSNVEGLFNQKEKCYKLYNYM
jgi:ribonuclease BN (tRNA processing enzyme)